MHERVGFQQTRWGDPTDEFSSWDEFVLPRPLQRYRPWQKPSELTFRQTWKGRREFARQLSNVTIKKG
jgi:hypothetical protein